MVCRPNLLTQLWFLKLQQIFNIFLETQKFKVCHKYHKLTISFFFQFVNMYILRYDRYSMTWFIKMEKISCMSIIYFVDISSLQNITFMKTEHMPTWMNKRRRYVTVWNQISKANKYLIMGILIGYFEYFFFMLWYFLVREPPIQLNWAWSYILCTSTYGNLFLS